MKILKFGGTSVGSSKAFKLVASIIKNEKNPIVVSSAMSGTTNALIQMAENASKGLDFQAQLMTLEKTHLTTINEILTEAKKEEINNTIQLFFLQLNQLLSSVKNIGELSERTKANIIGYGEQLSCKILTSYLQSLNINAKYVDARKLIVTNSIYNNASLDEQATQSNINEWVKTIGTTIPVITGFIAADKSQITTNLGRGGSDYTAAIIGAALNVAEIQIWTDVDGFYTADPRSVKNAFALPELAYEEAMELSYFGAKVIYPPTMIPAIKKQIPILIKNTFNKENKGTLIHQILHNDQIPVKGVSSIDDIILINIEGNGMIGFKGFSGRLFSALARANVNVILITQASSEHSISLAITPSDKAFALEAIEQEFEFELSTQKIEKPTYESEMSIIAVVGKNMKNAIGISGKLFSALGKNGINISAIAQGSSELNTSVVIKKNSLKKALNVVHDELFLSRFKTLNIYMAGLGNIGKELISQVLKASEKLQNNYYVQIKFAGISNSKKMVFNTENGIELNGWEKELNENGVNANFEDFVKEIKKQNLPNSIFVDNTSNSNIAENYLNIFDANCSIVACNKIANAKPLEYYNALRKSARKNGVDFMYETNVGAGLPLIKTIQDFKISGDEILKVEAILSGTISYVFNNFNGNKKFAEIIKEAQNLGYTEPDPRDDLNGLDFLRKVLIVGREIGMQLEKEDVALDNILPEACLNAKSIDDFYNELIKAEDYFETQKNKAASEQKVIRYMAVIENGKAKIELKMVDASHPFYSLSGSDNIISLTTTRYLNNPIVIKGPGAGAAVTAAGVFADIIRVSTN